MARRANTMKNNDLKETQTETSETDSQECLPSAARLPAHPSPELAKEWSGWK